MIARIWRGWTTPENANAYQELLTKDIMPGIDSRGISGLIKYQCMRREITNDDGESEMEFTTILWFEDLESIKQFAGEEYEVAHVSDKPRAVLKRFDEHSKHYEIFADKAC